MTKKFAVALFALLLVSILKSAALCVEFPQPPPSLPPDLQGSVQQVLASKPNDLFVVLKNGLSVLISQRAEDDVVSAQVFVRAGSLYEDKYLTAGISHYLEHVVSGGSTSSFTEAQAKDRLRQMGGETNAYTSFDRTVYYINTMSSHWEDTLDLLLSYVTECAFDPEEVRREKPVIQQEIKMGENNPGNELWKLFARTAYQVSPVRIPVIGYEEVFVHLDREALMSYYAEKYRPENMVVSVVGNIDPHAVLGFVLRKTKGLERKAGASFALPEEPRQTGTRWVEKEMPILRLTQAMISFPSVSLYDSDLYALDVLAILMGDGETSRLNRRLKEQEKKVLSVGASNWTPSFAKGQFIISLALPSQNWPDVLGQVQQETERFKKELVLAAELEKAKKSVIAQHVFEKETASAMASSLASSYFATGNPYFEDTYVEEIRKVTPESLRDAARRYLLTDRINVAVIKPQAQPEAPAASREASRAASNKPAVDSSQLPNGLKVLVKRDSSLPRVTLQLYGLGGLLLEGDQAPGISAFTTSLITAGTKKRTKLQIARAIEDVGGEMESKSDNNTYHVSIRVLKEDLDLALDILADVVQNAQFSGEEIEKKRQETLLAIQRQDESWQAEIMRFFKRSYFESSPYGHDRLGTVDSVNAFKREQVLQFYRRMVNPHHSVLAVYGDLDEKAASAKIREKFKTWTGAPATLPELPDETRRVTADRTVEKKNEKTSVALFVGTNGMGIHSPERPVLDLLDTVLSGANNPYGRLFEALRGGTEDLVYVVGSFPFYGENAGYFGVITQTTLGNLEKVQSAIMENLRKLAEEPLSDEDLQTAKSMLLAAHSMNMENLNHQAQSAAVNEALGLGWDYEKRYPELIRNVSAQDIQQLAKVLFAHTLIVRTIPENPVEILSAPPPHSDVRTPY
jgi:zinc protease